MSVPLMAGLIYFVKSTNWNYSAAETHLNGRRVAWPRGKVLGGTSSINGMMYMRGHRRDYDDWAQMGLHGWSYAEALPYFKRAEGHEDRRDRFHGTDGPFKISRARSTNPLYDAFVAGGPRSGLSPERRFQRGGAGGLRPARLRDSQRQARQRGDGLSQASEGAAQSRNPHAGAGDKDPV